MSTQFDVFADDYDYTFKSVPYREYMEYPSCVKLFGDMTGLSVLDLACGTGIYTRLIRKLGAAKVVGVDMSAGMVEVAQTIEEKNPLGIKYVTGEVSTMGQIGLFDCITAIYLFHYATSQEHLLSISKSIAANLKSGGRFITFVINPEIATHSDYYKGYNFYMEMNETLQDEDRLNFVTTIDGKRVDVGSFYRTKETIESVLTQANFTNIGWIKPHVSEEGIKKHGEAFWHNYLTIPHCIFIECFKQ